MPRDDAIATRWRARLALEFERRAARTVLASRRHDGPLVVQKALHPEGDAVCHAIVVHPPAGVAGGDELLIDVAAREGACALLTTPGAGKWYRSSGPWASQRVNLEGRAASSIEWLPQETIVYDGARADIGWEARLSGNATLIAWDIVCLGRTGSGERFDDGRLRTAARLVRDGRLAWLEGGRIEPGGALAHSPAGLAGRSVFGTMIVAAPAIDDEWLALARAQRPREGEAAATRIPGVLAARYCGDSSEAAREHFGAIWRELREPVTGRAPVEPRIWRT
ncbi:MAG TPA: urease accessory protein UreD [Usitatibacter sp.]|nr:urease accessory protein UreD [Usitatibacter sp.]